jgi:hypothetical protein
MDRGKGLVAGISLVRALLVGSLLLIVCAAPASADTVYTYIGNPFTTFQDFFPYYFAPCYSGGCQLQGSFDVAQPLGPNLNNYSPTLLNYGFAVVPVLGIGFPAPGWLMVSTDSSGAIIDWNFQFQLNFGSYNGLVNYFLISGSSTSDYAQIAEITGGGHQAYYSGGNYGSPGTWTVSPAPAPVPEPGSIVLFGTGLAALGGLVRRRLDRTAKTRS